MAQQILRPAGELAVRSPDRSIVARAAWLAPVLALVACDDGCKPKPPAPTPPPPAAACPAIRIAQPAPLTSIWDDGTAAMAIALEVAGDHSAEAVVITAVTLAGGVTVEPAALPLAAGDFLPRRPLTVQARFQVAADGSARDVRVVGDARIGGQACHFDAVATVAPATAPTGPVDARPITVAKVTAATASWPPPPPPVARRPNVEEVVPIPLGPPRNLMTTAPAESRIARLPDITGDPVTPPEQGTHTAVFTRNNVAGNYGGTPPDPSVAATSNSGVVIISANTAVSWSKDWGATFTDVALTGITDPANPARTTFFPAKDRGLCCDQVLTYSAKHDLFIWVIQTWATEIASGTSTTKIRGPNRLYLAWAKPSAVATDFLHAWSWIELDSALFGIGNDWMDYPDVTVSDANVYVSVDRVHGYLVKEKDPKDGKEKDVAKDSVIARIYARVSLADLAGGGGVGGAFVVLDHPGIIKGHIARESPDTMYFAALLDTSKLRAYTWPDTAGSVSWFDVPMTSINDNDPDYASKAPDGVNWNTGPRGILGAVLTRPRKLCFGGGDCDPSEQRVAWYAFPAGRNPAAGRAEPYVRLAAIDMRAARLKTEVDLWNATVASALPSLSAACAYDICDLAVSLAVGGGGRYPDNAVGFVNDGILYVTTASDATQSWDCTPEKATTKSYCSRWGDYFNVVPSQGPKTAYGHGGGYSTLAYSVRASTPGKTCATGGCVSRLQYVQFGRDGALIPSRPPR